MRRTTIRANDIGVAAGDVLLNFSFDFLGNGAFGVRSTYLTSVLSNGRSRRRHALKVDRIVAGRTERSFRNRRDGLIAGRTFETDELRKIHDNIAPDDCRVS